MQWIRLVSGIDGALPVAMYIGGIRWSEHTNKQARKFLRTLRELSKRYIDFRKICATCAKMLDDNRKKFCSDRCREKYEKAYLHEIKRGLRK